MDERIKTWREQNAARILEKARRILQAEDIIAVAQAHPRLVYIALDQGSWQDLEGVQEMWAGLLASSCSGDGRDESNLMFINTLAQMTSNECRIFNHACSTCEKMTSPGGLILAQSFECRLNALRAISGIDDVQRLDRELDHLRMLGLFSYGFSPLDEELVADITPSSLALHMYVRCQGFNGSPLAYFDLL